MPELGDSDDEEETKIEEPATTPWFDGEDPGDMSSEELVQATQKMHRLKKRKPWMDRLAQELKRRTKACDVDKTRSHVRWAPMSDDVSLEADKTQHAQRHPPLPKPECQNKTPGKACGQFGLLNGLFKNAAEPGRIYSVDQGKKWELMP